MEEITKNTSVQNKSIWKPLIYAVILAIGIVGGYFLKNPSLHFVNTGNEKLDQVVRLINRAYVDTVDEKKLTDAAIVEMLQNLDPHSTYIPAAELQASNEQLEGNFEGIGVEFNLLNDTIFISSVISGGPSEKVGIMPGDRIIKVEDKTVAGIGITNEEVIKNLKGEKGTDVTVYIKRPGEKDLLKFTITRDRIPIYSVEAAFMAGNGIGYIKLSRFAKETYNELVSAMDKLRKEGMTSLVLDLRGNPGGYLDAATKITSEFLGKDKLMVYTEGRSQTKREYKTTDEGSFTTGKLVILVDESSASASEIVSGAVQDWDRGVIVGRRSYGKGLVQESFMLKDRSAIRLTIARYYTPTGRSIQKPYDEGYDEYETEIDHRFSSGELDNPDSIKKNEKLAYKTPSGRKVYGGGGIYPDVFVPLDSALHNELVTTVFRNGFISRLAYNYVDRHRVRLKKLGSLEAFSKQFSFEGELKSGLEKLLADSKITYTEEEFKGALPLFASQTKALIARQVFGKNAYYQVLNETDNTFEMALESMKDYEAILKGESKLAWYGK